MIPSIASFAPPLAPAKAKIASSASAATRRDIVLVTASFPASIARTVHEKFARSARDVVPVSVMLRRDRSRGPRAALVIRAACSAAALARAATTAIAAAAVASVACTGIRLGDSSGADAGAPSAAPAAGDGGVSGIDCVREPTTGAALCTAVTSCPDVAVDHDAYPHCGFRVRFGGLDVECACGDQLCPIGAPVTCDDVRALLAAQSEATVCTQVSEGRCTASSPAPAPSGTGGAAGSTCDHACSGECGGDPGCIKLCGC